MELKNALAVCLISLFSATLVVLIARSLDSQAASRIEPQLAKIVQELEAIRTSGGISTAITATTGVAHANGVAAYYFHGNTRCPTCRSIEEQAHTVVRQNFTSELDSGDLTWTMLNYEESNGEELGSKFEVQMPVVVVVQMEQGQIAQWKRLDKVWALVGDQPAFAQYVRGEIRAMLDASTSEPEMAVPAAEEPSVVVSDDDTDALPLPTGPGL
jgi:hypothetical protein